MNIVCSNMEGVLVPEIRIAFVEKVGIPDSQERRMKGRHHAALAATMVGLA